MIARIIPARAGFTKASRWGGREFPDHPRSRGVYLYVTGRILISAGSSPLARGLPAGAIVHDYNYRIIPARAGFTRRSDAGQSPPRDHPRSRGVYRTTCWSPGRSSGSSPLARGLHRHRHPLARGRRIIPARAGFTWPSPSTAASRADHPRSRGVYVMPCQS